MLELYIWPWPARLSITFLLAVCIFAQTLALALCAYRQPRGRCWLAEGCLELALLLHLLCCSLLHGEVMLAYELTLIPPTGYVALRMASVGLVTLTAVAAACCTRRLWPLLCIPAACVLLPLAERLLDTSFTYFYIAALLFYLLRSIVLCLRRYRDMRTGLSSRSVKDAIDLLHTGILFYEPDGFTLLSNRCMQRLMLALTGQIQRNGLHFQARLRDDGTLEDGCATTELAGQLVCLLPDGSAWMFTSATLRIAKRDYLQLTATDITDRWQLTAQLQQQNAQLQRRSEELGAALASLHVLSREREMQNAKTRAHDILGQRLTLLLRTLRSERMPAPELIHALSQGLMEDLSAARSPPAPQAAFEDLCAVFSAIGVTLQRSGPLPEGALGHLLVDILRESTTNAVRHGFATEVHAEFDADGDGYRAHITNNGRAPDGAIVEGGGLSGMRAKLAPHGGTLQVQTEPLFALTIQLPGGDGNV